MLARELAGLGLEAKVILNADVYRSKMALAEVKPEIVLGSNIERHAIEEMDIPFMIQLVNPICTLPHARPRLYGLYGHAEPDRDDAERLDGPLSVQETTLQGEVVNATDCNIR